MTTFESNTLGFIKIPLPPTKSLRREKALLNTLASQVSSANGAQI